MLDTPGGSRVFESVSDRRLRAYLSIAGAVILVLVALGCFFLALRGHPSPLLLQGTTTVPILLALGLFTSGFAALRTPTRVIVAPHEIVVLGGHTSLGRWPWQQISLASTGATANGAKRTLTLYDEAGKKLVKLTDDLGDFDLLVEDIKRRMAENPSRQRTTVAQKKGRRRGAFLVIAGVGFLALAGANAWIALTSRQSAELLKSRGQPAEAIIVRKFTAPDGHTRRIEYRIDAPNAPTENVEILPNLWPLLQVNQRIPAIAVPGRPDVSHLVAGQVEDNANIDPGILILLSAAIAIMSLLFIAAGLLNLRGLDLKWDKSRNRPRLVPLGSE